MSNRVSGHDTRLVWSRPHAVGSAAVRGQHWVCAPGANSRPPSCDARFPSILALPEHYGEVDAPPAEELGDPVPRLQRDATAAQAAPGKRRSRPHDRRTPSAPPHRKIPWCSSPGAAPNAGVTQARPAPLRLPCLKMLIMFMSHSLRMKDLKDSLVLLETWKKVEV